MIFFSKINYGFYIKVKSTNYKQVFTEFKIVDKLLRYCNFCIKFPIQTHGPQFFWGQFLRKLKKILKIYILLHFLSNLFQIFKECFCIISRKRYV